MLVILSLVYVLRSILVRVCRVRRDVARIHHQPPELSLRGSPWGTAISRSELNNPKTSFSFYQIYSVVVWLLFREQLLESY